MQGAYAGLWGLFGGFAVEGLDFWVSCVRFRMVPWKVNLPTDGNALPAGGPAGRSTSSEAGDFWLYIAGEVIRLIIGAGLAWATASTGQISGPLGALGVGAAAPAVIGQLIRTTGHGMVQQTTPTTLEHQEVNTPHAKLSEPTASAEEARE